MHTNGPQTASEYLKRMVVFIGFVQSVKGLEGMCGETPTLEFAEECWGKGFCVAHAVKNWASKQAVANKPCHTDVKEL